MTKKRRNRRPRPIAARPTQMKSRKKARQITTQFHKITSLVSQAEACDDHATVDRLNSQVEAMWEDYQEASRLSTKFHSTSRWVLRVLSELKLLVCNSSSRNCFENGSTFATGDEMTTTIPLNHADNIGTASESDESLQSSRFRPLKLLEVGAINTELIEAASRTKRVRVDKFTPMSSKANHLRRESGDCENEKKYMDVPIYNLTVRAIDLRSSHPKIEEADFLTLPQLNNDNELPSSQGSYDVIVCSMVLNCVTSPIERGKMLSKLYKFLHPGGFCFLTLPRRCLSQSKYLNKKQFELILVEGLGFQIERTKESPKVAFWVLKRPLPEDGRDKVGKMEMECKTEKWKNQWSMLKQINVGRKFRNDFGVILANLDSKSI